jgi:hypothetical protein
MADTSSHVSLDKRIPVAFLFAILVQTGVIVWHLAMLSSQVTHNTARIAEVDRLHTLAISRTDGVVAGIPERLGRIETSVQFISEALKIEAKRPRWQGDPYGDDQ